MKPFEIDYAEKMLELRHYKNDSTKSKNFLVLKLARFFVVCIAIFKTRMFFD